MLVALSTLAVVAIALVLFTRTHAIIIYNKKDHPDMAAIDDLNTAIARVQAYVATLKTDLANADQTPAIEAATAALDAIAPAPVAGSDGAVDPGTGLPV